MKVFESPNRSQIVISLAMAELTTRNMLRGILRRIRGNQQHDFRFCLGRPDDPKVENCLTDKCAGFITDHWSPQIADTVKKHNIPTIGINLTPVPKFLIGSISSLHGEIGRLAANHLAGLGFKTFAYVPVSHKFWWCAERRKCFETELRKLGFDCNVYNDKQNLGEWLKTLPLPCAVFASTDPRAREVIDACRAASLRVPADISVMGVDNDELICETTEPGLTSIEWNTEEIGFSAASLLLDTIAGATPRPKKPEQLFYVGARLISRASTYANLTRDPLVEKCRTAIRADISRKITVTTLAAELGVVKRTLERRFFAGTGHSVHDEVLSARISAAREMIAAREMSLDAVATHCGFYDASHLCRMLKRASITLS